MIAIHIPNVLLFIEPSSPPSQEPLIDEVVKKMTTALLEARKAGRIGFFDFSCAEGKWWSNAQAPGGHECDACKEQGRDISSLNYDFEISGRLYTHSLCLHYLAYHREEVPEWQINRILGLQVEQTEPEIKWLTEGFSLS